MSRKIVHYIAQTLIIAALLVATAFALRPLQHLIHERMVALKHQIVLDLEAATRRAISYSSISPSIFRYIEVRDLVIYGKSGERGRLLQVKRLKIYYDVFALLQGNIAGAVTSISVENTHVVLDTRRDQDVIRFIASLTSGSAGSAGPVRVPRLTVQGKNLAINLTGPQGSVEADHIFFTFSPESGSAPGGPTAAGSALSLKWKSNVRVTLARPVLSVRNLSSPVSVTATIHPAALQPANPAGEKGAGADYPHIGAEAMVVFDQLSANTFGIVRQAFRLNYRNGALTFRKVEDRAPINLAGQLDLRNQSFSANFQTEDFVPSQYVTVRPPLDVVAPWLDTALTGKATFRYGIGDGKAAYTARFAASNNNRRYADLKTVSLDLQGNEKLATVNRMEIHTSVGSAEFTGTVTLADMLPDGRLKISDLTAGGMEPLNADIAVTRKENSVELSQKALSYGGATVHDLRVKISPYAGRPSFDVRFSMDGEGKSLADFSGSTGRESSLDGRIESLPLAPLYRIFRAAAPGLAAAGVPVPAGILPPAAVVSDTVRLNAEFSLSRGPDRLTVSAPQFLLYDTAAQNNNLALSVAANNQSISVDNLQANFRGYSASGHLDAAVRPGGAVAFTGGLKLQDVPYSFEGSYSPGNELFITESHGLTARVSFGRFDQIGFQIGGTDIPVPIDQRTVRFNVQASGLYTDPQTWELNINQFSARNLPFVPYPSARFSMAARITPGRGSIESITYADDVSTLQGNGSVTYELGSAAGPAADRLNGRVFLQLENRKQDESYRVDVSLSSGTLGGDVIVRNLPFKRFGLRSLDGGVDGQIRLSGTTSAPVFDAQASLNGATYGGQPLGGSVTAHWADNTVRLSPVNITYRQNIVIGGSALADFAKGTLGVDATVRDQAAQPKPLDVKVSFSATYHPPESPLDFGAILAGDVSANLGISGLPFQQNLGTTWQFSLTKSGKQISMGGGPSNSLNGNINETGDFVLSATAPLPIVFHADGRIKGDTVEANINNIHFNLSLVKHFLDFQVFQLTQGDVTGSLRINGSAADPDFYGTLSVADARAQLAYTPDTLGPAKTFLVFEEKRVTMTRFAVPVAKGTGSVSGTFTMSRWAPETLALEIVVPGDEGMHVDYTFGNVVVNGYTNGVVKITSSPGLTTVTGSLLAYQTNITLADIGSPVSAPTTASSEAPVHVDMTIETGKRVEFLWPTSAIPVLRGYARLGQSIHIGLATDTGTFSLRGDVGIQSGEIFYFERSFYIKDGMIRFNENENYFDPRLSVNAEIREISSNGPVRISLVANDERLSQFTPRFVSDPAMTDAQIAALLGGNFFGELGNNQNGLSSAVYLTSDLVGQFSIVRSFENMVRDALSLDLFSIRTQLFSNLLRGAIGGSQPSPVGSGTTGTPTSGTQYPLDNTSSSLGKYLDNTTVFLGKYLGTDLFLELLVQLQAQNPYSTTEQARSFGGLVINPEINLDWRTPFFDLQWSFLPQTPQTLFLTDNTISLSWGFTY